MTSAARFAVWALGFLALLVAVPSPPATASTADLEHRDCAYECGIGSGECQHFLRNPAGPTDDPCWCDKCRNAPRGARHDGKTVPSGWNATLFAQGGMECYLKRHAVAWGITCSECLTNTKPWPDGGDGGTGTVPEKDFAGRPARDTVLARREVERKLFRKPDDVVVAYDRHFYVVTDIDGLKVRMPGGSARAMSAHEWTHLMIERAEFARREFVRNLGEPIVMRGKEPRPIAVYLPDRMRDFQRIGAAYFKNPGSNGLRGAVAELCDGMCLTGTTFSKEECGDDERLLVYLRHQIAHALLSVWGSLETRPKSLPVWMDEGLAHWLTKSIDKCRDGVFYCTSEGLGGPSSGGGPAWPGKDWDKDVVKYVQGGKLASIEDLLAKTVLGDMSEQDQKRAWSIFDVCLTDCRGPFAKMLAALRREESVRKAFTDNLGCSPEVFDERWKERVLGKRKSMAADAGDAAEGDDVPGARDRKAIAAEQDPRNLANRIRQLGEIKDPKTIPVVVDVISRDLDLPRETALVSLLGVKDPACREAIWSYGLAHKDGIVRAYVAKLCGRLALTAALPRLEAQLEDENWYARAEAAVACGVLKDRKALPALRKMVLADASEKARVGAMDAVGMFGDGAADAVPYVAKHLDSAQWQLRITAAQTLGEIGSMEGVEPLLERFEKESGGRVADDVYQALKKITRDDLGRRPENWRKWWDAQKAGAQGGTPKRPDLPPGGMKAPEGDDAHATHDAAPYFGIELYTSRVAFICDTSESMSQAFTPDPSAAKALSRTYMGADKLTILKEEVAQALSKLDPRSHFNVITFGTQIKAYKSRPVPASPGNVDQARGFLRSLSAVGETDYYDALKTALDVGAEPDTNPDFRTTPDTITFLTDGEPTKGDILDADVLVEWYTGLNRYARVRTHTITFGVVSVDVDLLRAMAERNGGRFTLIPEKPMAPR